MPQTVIIHTVVTHSAALVDIAHYFLPFNSLLVVSMATEHLMVKVYYATANTAMLCGDIRSAKEFLLCISD